MREKAVACIVCGQKAKVPIINEPWCQSCIRKEEERHQKEDNRPGLKFSRPPKYVLPEDQWASFGY